MNRQMGQKAGVNPPSPQIASPDAAQKLASHLVQVMDALVKTVALETELVRSGRIREAMSLDEQKTDLSHSYVTAISQLRTNQSYLAKTTPDLLNALHRHHENFRATLQINLTVLATAHAVSEGIVRGVQGEMQRKTAPQTYNASGYNSAPGPRHAAPLAVSRKL